MIAWPDELVDDIARRRSVLYLGAGISMNAKTQQGAHPKSWTQLLSEGAGKVRHKAKLVVKRLIREKDYLTACEILKAEMGRTRYESMLTKEFLEPQFAPAKVHDVLFEIDSRIVATPNIDKIYDSHANHLAKGSIKIKHYYEEDVADAIRRSNRVILKVHGTIDTPSKMIFTRREYAEARTKHAEFYAILDALVTTNTFVFLGCGGNDPDIRLVLENYAFRFKHSRSHYMTLPEGAISPEEAKALEDSMNLEILLYSPRTNHRELLDSIEELQQLVEHRRGLLSQSLDW